MVGTALHEVEGDVERCEVGVIRVVDKRTASLSVFYLKSHGNRLKRQHTLLKLLWCNSKMKCHHGCCY